MNASTERSTSDLLREMREPAPTAGEVAMPEPYAHQAIWHVSNPAEMGWEQWHDKNDPLPTKWDDEPPTHVVSVVTMGQCRAYGDARALAAVRVPLSEEQLTAVASLMYTLDTTIHNEETWFLRGARFAEEQHGIPPAPTEGGAA